MSPAEVSQHIEKLVSTVRRSGGAMPVIAFYAEMMAEFAWLEHDVEHALREAMDAGRLDINLSWQVIIP